MARDPKTFWGWTSAFVAAIPAAAAGTIHGTANALNGKSFEEGFEQTSNACMDTVTEFVDEHEKTITKAVLGAAAAWGTKQGLDAAKQGMHTHNNHSNNAK